MAAFPDPGSRNILPDSSSTCTSAEVATGHQVPSLQMVYELMTTHQRQPCHNCQPAHLLEMAIIVRDVIGETMNTSGNVRCVSHVIPVERLPVPNELCATNPLNYEPRNGIV